MTDAPTPFAPRGTHQEIEEGARLMPKFGPDGLIAAVVADDETGEVVMFAWMNAEALARTVETGEAWYWSRSRNALWHKGATSGHVQAVTEMRVDCDQDAILLRVKTAGTGANCHTGRKSCFYRIIPTGRPATPDLALEPTGDLPRFDPADVYPR